MSKFETGALVTINWDKFVTIAGLDETSVGIVVNVSQGDITARDMYTVMWADLHRDIYITDQLVAVA